MRDCLDDAAARMPGRAPRSLMARSRATVALRLKYGGRIGLAETVARLMARLMPADADLLVPVPLASLADVVARVTIRRR